MRYRHYSVVYILREQEQIFFFFKYVLKKKRQNKTSILSPYQNALVFSAFEYIKMVCVLTPYQDVLVFFALKNIKWLDLMNIQTNLDCLQN